MTANDSDVSDGDILTGSQVVRVYGQNLTAPFVTLTFGDVEYTPLTQGEGYIEFILGDNGTATINVDGSRFMSFEVEGVVVPEGFPTKIQGFLCNRVSATYTDDTCTEGLRLDNVSCINYPHKDNNEYPHFLFIFYGVELVAEQLSLHNATIGASRFDGSKTYLNIDANDENEVSYIKLDDFIIAVFNYLTT